MARTVERKCGNSVRVFPRLLQTPPVDSIPHDDIAVTASGSERAKSGMKRYGINRIHYVEIFGFVGDTMALEGIPIKIMIKSEHVCEK